MIITILILIALAVLVHWMFIGYRYSFGPFRALGDIRLRAKPGNDKRYDMDTADPLADSPLKGKRVLFLGSSVTYGSASLRQGIPEYCAARLGCSAVREAVSGTTLVDTGKSSYVQRFMKHVTPGETYDLVICQLSTNDATKGLPLGEISQGRSPGDFDTGTITGAMEYIIATAMQTWGCGVVFYTGARYGSPAYEAMVARLYELSDKWGVGILDLWSSDDFNTLADSDRALYMNDPIHPTKAGYRCWWCPEMERQLLNFLAGGQEKSTD